MELKYVFYYFHLEFPYLHDCQYCEIYCHNENIRVTVGKKKYLYVFVAIVCDDGWVPYNNQCYLFSTSADNFANTVVSLKIMCITKNIKIIMYFTYISVDIRKPFSSSMSFAADQSNNTLNTCFT